MLCNDFTGPARFRLNMPEVALELKRVSHSCLKSSIQLIRKTSLWKLLFQKALCIKKNSNFACLVCKFLSRFW